MATIDGKELPDASLVYLMNFALQSLQDAYAGADDLTDAIARFEKKRDALLDGTIGVRSGGGGMTDEDRAAIYVAETWYRAKFAKDSPEIKKLGELDDKSEFLQTIADKLATASPDAWKAQVDKRVAHVLEMRKLRADGKRAVSALPDIDI